MAKLKSFDDIPETGCTQVDTIPTTFFWNVEGVFIPVGGGPYYPHFHECFVGANKDEYIAEFSSEGLVLCQVPERMIKGEILRLSFEVTPDDVDPLWMSIQLEETEYNAGSGWNTVKQIYPTEFQITAPGTYEIPLDALITVRNDPWCNIPDQITWSASVTAWLVPHRDYPESGLQQYACEVTLTATLKNGTVYTKTDTSSESLSVAAFFCRTSPYVAHGGSISLGKIIPPILP